MTDKEQITALGNILSEDSVLAHMTGHRQPRKVDTDSLEITVNGDSARMTGRSRVNAAVYGGGRHTWRLRMDSELRKIDGAWKITYSKASMY